MGSSVINKVITCVNPKALAPNSLFFRLAYMLLSDFFLFFILLKLKLGSLRVFYVFWWKVVMAKNEMVSARVGTAALHLFREAKPRCFRRRIVIILPFFAKVDKV